MVVPREKNAPHEVVIVGGGFGGLGGLGGLGGFGKIQ